MTKLLSKKIVLATAILLFSCTQSSKKMDLQTGDILFCSYSTGDLSSSIDSVTQTQKATHYSHMALVEVVGADTFVIHASLKRGVVKELLNKFLQIDQPSLVDIYRLKDSQQFAVSAAINQVNKFVGMPYNSHYRMNDTCYYCSQLIYDAFKADSIFKLEPMTFKNPNSEEFNEGWINHYKAMGMDIPEGELGCNPNGLAVSENLQLVRGLIP